MTGTSPRFLLFAIAVVVLFNLSGRPAWKRSILLVASAIFVALLASQATALIPLIAFILVGYAFNQWKVRSLGSSFSLLVGVFLALFIWFKKYSFLPLALFLPFPYV